MNFEKKIATRDGFGDEIVALGKENRNILIVDADIGKSCKTGAFRKELPDQYLNVGIAEQNCAGVAAGLATCGKIPFVVTYAAFGSMRMVEMIRQEICYPHLNVKIAATHAGISVGEDGATHQCNEDIALMRTIPGMVVINPADDVEAKAAVKAAAEYVGPVYLRFGRLAAPVFNDAATYKFEMGKGITLRDGKDVTIVATGILVGEAIKSGELLAADGIDARIINIHTIKPIDKELMLKASRETGRILTCEEHSVIGGLGAAVMEAIAEEAPCKVSRLGVNDQYGHSGPGAKLLEEYGFTAENIAARAKKMLK